MTSTEYYGLFALTFSLGVLAAWLRLRRAPAAEWGKKRVEFCVSLFATAGFSGIFARNFNLPAYLPPTSWEVILLLLAVLLMLRDAMKELRIAFRARNAGDQQSPADSDS
jgi:hypothetical protein